MSRSLLCVYHVVCQNYIIILVLMAFEAIVHVHQLQYYKHHEQPRAGIVFTAITRAEADRDLTHCIKFLVNYAFYKFGREVRL